MSYDSHSCSRRNTSTGTGSPSSAAFVLLPRKTKQNQRKSLKEDEKAVGRTWEGTHTQPPQTDWAPAHTNRHGQRGRATHMDILSHTQRTHGRRPTHRVPVTARPNAAQGREGISTGPGGALERRQRWRRTQRQVKSQNSGRKIGDSRASSSRWWNWFLITSSWRLAASTLFLWRLPPLSAPVPSASPLASGCSAPATLVGRCHPVQPSRTRGARCGCVAS